MNFWEFLAQTSAVWGTVLTVLAGGGVGVVATQLNERSKRKSDTEDHNRELAQQAAAGFLATATDVQMRVGFAIREFRANGSRRDALSLLKAELHEVLVTNSVPMQQNLLTLRILGYDELSKSAGDIADHLGNIDPKLMDRYADRWLELSKDFSDLCVVTFGSKTIVKK